MIDIGPGGDIWPCFPLSQQSFKLKQFGTLGDIYRHFNRMNAAECILYDEKCQDCAEREAGSCHGGCRGISAPAGQFRNDPSFQYSIVPAFRPEDGTMRLMRTPKKVDIAITNRCNLRCRYCYHFESAGDVDGTSPTGEWSRFFEDLNRCAVTEVTLAGGEPFMREDLKEIINGIVKNRMRFAILSNGTLITDEMAAFLASTGRCNHVQISIDGSMPAAARPWSWPPTPSATWGRVSPPASPTSPPKKGSSIGSSSPTNRG